MMTIRRAVPADRPTVSEILAAAADKLHERGIDQWPAGSPSMTPASIGAQIERGETWLVIDGRDPVATIAATDKPDPDFWTPAEQAEPAIYISKAAVVPPRAGEGIGELALRWIVDLAAAEGRQWARLDAWKTNEKLHAYYLARGWTYLRTEDLPHRRSGALFQRPAAPDPQARAALPWRQAPEVTRDDLLRLYRDTWLAPGTAVIAAAASGPVAATITEVIGPDYSTGIEDRRGQYGAGRPPVMYVVTGQGRTWTAPEGFVWPDPDEVPTPGPGAEPRAALHVAARSQTRHG